MALNATLPLIASPDNVLKIVRVKFAYSGPAANLFACFGLKRRGGLMDSVNFDNGYGLEGGPNAFGYAALSVAANEQVDKSVATTWPLRLGEMPADRKYNTFKWLTKGQPTADESYIVKGVNFNDDDADVVDLRSSSGGSTTPPSSTPATGNISLRITGYGPETAMFTASWRGADTNTWKTNNESWIGPGGVATWFNQPLRGVLILWTRDWWSEASQYGPDVQWGPWEIDWAQQTGMTLDIRNGQISE